MSGSAPVVAMTPDDARRAQRRAWRVVAAMQRELRRQVAEGTLISIGQIDSAGRLVIEGQVDLAMLAFVTEAVLQREFGV